MLKKVEDLIVPVLPVELLEAENEPRQCRS